jgi:hypothetical protein
MSKAPDNASGAGTEPPRDAMWEAICAVTTDASRLLAQKDAELQRLRAALEMCVKYLGGHQTRNIDTDKAALDAARAALNP